MHGCRWLWTPNITQTCMHRHWHSQNTHQITVNEVQKRYSTFFLFQYFLVVKSGQKRFFPSYRIWDFNAKRHKRTHAPTSTTYILYIGNKWHKFYSIIDQLYYMEFIHIFPHKKVCCIRQRNSTKRREQNEFFWDCVCDSECMFTQSFHFHFCVRFRFRSFARLVLIVIVAGWQTLSVY